MSLSQSQPILVFPTRRAALVVTLAGDHGLRRKGGKQRATKIKRGEIGFQGIQDTKTLFFLLFELEFIPLSLETIMLF